MRQHIPMLRNNGIKPVKNKVIRKDYLQSIAKILPVCKSNKNNANLSVVLTVDRHIQRLFETAQQLLISSNFLLS